MTLYNASAPRAQVENYRKSTLPRNLFKWARKFDCVEGIVVEEWNEFIPGNDEKPYAFVQELYETRRAAKPKQEYDIVELAIKLVLNSLYGKTVQSVGGDEENALSCACPYYGAAVTANCRARLIEAAILDPYANIRPVCDCLFYDGWNCLGTGIDRTSAREGSLSRNRARRDDHGFGRLGI
jgi:hypothetical protein